MEALNINKTEIIVDKDIRLKVVEPEDAEPIFNTIEREYLKEWLPFVEETHDIAYTKSFIENTIATPTHMILHLQYPIKINLLELSD